jgi:hypothetical protein
MNTKKIILVAVLSMCVIIATATPTWLGNQSFVQSTSSQSVTFTVWINDNYVGLNCRLFVSPDGVSNWTNYSMAYSGSNGVNSIWTYTLALTSSNTYKCYFQGYDSWGYSQFLNNGGANYSFTVNPTTQSAGNWNDGGTWFDGAVPASTSAHCIIANNITLNADKTVGSVTINTGSTLTASDGTTRTLTISAGGEFTNNGTFSAATGVVNFAGSGTIKGATATTFNNLTINTGVLTLTTVPTVNGIFSINGGNINTSLNYGSESTLEYNLSYSRYVEWNSTSGAGYPHHVKIKSGTFKLRNANDDLKSMAGNLTIDSGATFDLDGMTDGYGGNNHLNGLEVAGSIINNGTIVFSSANKKLKCTDFTNAGSTTLSAAYGGDLIVEGNFINTGTFSSNQRAVFFTGANTQTATGTAQFEIEYLRIVKSGGSVKLLSNLTCKGANGQNAVVIDGAASVLDLNGNALTVGLDGADSNFNNGIASPGKIKGGGNSKLYIVGSGSLGTINFDTSTPGTTNLLHTLEINRSSSGSVTIGNNIEISNLLDIKNGAVTASDITLKAGSVGRLSSTNTEASLSLTNLIFGKTSAASAQFYKNGRTLTLSGGNIKVKVSFDQTGKWHFVGFPFAISLVQKSDLSAATIGVDYSLGQYNAVKRAQRLSGWESSTDNPMIAKKGYLINRKNTSPDNKDLYFVTTDNGSSSVFDATATVPLVYTTESGGLEPNFGWNFISHPMSASGTANNADGQFYYSYNAALDTYKLWYDGALNPGYSSSNTSSSGRSSFDSYFVKCAVASNATYTLTSPQGVPSSVRNTTLNFELALECNNSFYTTNIREKAEATLNYDQLYDAPLVAPMLAGTPQIFTIANDTRLSLNSLSKIDSVNVGIKVSNIGEYAFNWNKSEVLSGLSLVDRNTGAWTKLSETDEYRFETQQTGEITNRFRIYQSKRIYTLIDDTEQFIHISQYNKNLCITIDSKYFTGIKIYNLQGVLLDEFKNFGDKILVDSLDSGIYLIEFQSQNKCFTRKVTIK